MQEPLFPSTVTYKLYNERAILIATFVGGPLAGGYLLARNFGALNEPAKAGKTWIITIGIMLLLVVSVFIPAADAIPGFVYSLLFCCTAHFAARKYQGSSIALHQTNGGRLYTTWRAVLTGLVFMVLMIGLILALFYLQDRSVF
jgi:uncharacterized integral membrane protein